MKRETPKTGEIIEISNGLGGTHQVFATGERHHHQVEYGDTNIGGSVHAVNITPRWRRPGETEWKN